MASVKGHNGVLIIIGGSSLYTGAPYFTALSAMRCGVDLVYIFTHKETLIPLKVLSPESIVLDFICEDIEWIIKRASVIILGSGLGRVLSNKWVDKIKYVLSLLKDQVLIIDGDGLYFIHHNNITISGIYSIATPNINEQKYVSNQTYTLVVKKGEVDSIVENGVSENVLCEYSCKKRCGGQGDILCGIIAAHLRFKSVIPLKEIVIKGLKILRHAAYKGYCKYGKGLITSDIIKELL